MSRYVKTVNFIKNLVSGSKTSPTISSVTLSKNLAKRRADQDSIVAGVDKHLKSSDTTSSKIKKKFTKQASSIHDKYEKKADGGRMGYKDGTKSGRKMGGGSNMSNTAVKKKFKNLGNLPETIQIKIAGKKIAKKV